MRVSKRVQSIAMLATLAACGGDTTTAPPSTPSTPSTPTNPTGPTGPTGPTPPGPTGNYSGALSTSATSPNVGDKVTIWLRVQRANASDPKVGSFAAQVSYDSTALKWDAAADRGGDALVAANSPVASLIKVAGAAANGFATDTVAQFSVIVLKSGGLSSLKVLMTEITTTAFETKVTNP